MKIQYVQIFGERCSGTNFISQLIKKNLEGIEITKDFGGKHWFIKNHYPRGRPNDSTDYQCIRPLSDSSDTLFVCIFRDPYDWVRSIRQTPWHANNHNALLLRDFIRKPWNSFEHTRQNRKWPNRQDHFWFIEEAINILQLRSLKIKHLLNLENKVDHICYVNYEKIAKDNSELRSIAGQFHIPIRHESLEAISKRLGRGAGKTDFSPTQYPEISLEDLSFINNELDWELENQIGYHIRKP